MDTLHDIEAAVDALPETDQKELFNYLADRLQQPAKVRELPLVPPTGNPITQQDIDDALDAD